MDHEINIPTIHIHISDNSGHTEDETTCLIIYTGRIFTAGAEIIYGWRHTRLRLAQSIEIQLITAGASIKSGWRTVYIRLALLCHVCVDTFMFTCRGFMCIYVDISLIKTT